MLTYEELQEKYSDLAQDYDKFKKELAEHSVFIHSVPTVINGYGGTYTGETMKLCYKNKPLEDWVSENEILSKRVKELEEEIEKLEGKNEALKERIKYPYIKIDKADYGEKQRIYLRIKTWYKYGYSIDDIEKFIEYDSYILNRTPIVEAHFIERLITEAGAEYLKRGFEHWKDKQSKGR